MFIFFNIVYLLAAIVIFPVLILRGKWHKEFFKRCGFLSKRWRQPFGGVPTLWVHAVSVGEVITVCGFVRQLKDQFEHRKIVCSVVTTTGYALAQERLGDVATIIYAPLDFSWVVKKYIVIIDPCIYIAAETEIWPNLYAAFAQKNIPIVQINGRISDKSYGGYKRLAPLFKPSLKAVQLFCMQSRRDAERIVNLGANADAVKVLGNLKFDATVSQVVLDGKLEALRNSNCIFFLAGSTHPGEEEIIYKVFNRVKELREDLRLIIAPRHIERVDEVVKDIASQYQPIKLSEYSGKTLRHKDVLIVDTIGKLTQLYSLASLVFVGKTFTVGGGQNMIEPAAFGKPTIVGPQTENFKDVMQLLLEGEGILQVETVEQLMEKCEFLLMNAVVAQDLGHRAKTVVEKNQGATKRCIDEISTLIK